MDVEKDSGECVQHGNSAGFEGSEAVGRGRVLQGVNDVVDAGSDDVCG